MTTPGPSDNDFGYPVVAVPPTATRPDAVVRFLVGELVAPGWLTEAAVERVVEAVLRRETLGTTGIGQGIALPHAECDDVQDVAIVMGRLTEPIDWLALDGKSVRLVCLMVTPRNTPGATLKGLEEIVRQLRRGRE